MLLRLAIMVWKGVCWLMMSLLYVLKLLLTTHYNHRERQNVVFHTVYSGKWLLSDNAAACGRPVVIRDALNHFQPGVELIYFGDESPDQMWGDKKLKDENEAVDMANQMLQRVLGQRHRVLNAA